MAPRAQLPPYVILLLLFVFVILAFQSFGRMNRIVSNQIIQGLSPFQDENFIDEDIAPVTAKRPEPNTGENYTLQNAPVARPQCVKYSNGGPNEEFFLFADFHATKGGGGVGNFMFEWISFLGIAKTTGRIPALHLKNSIVPLMLNWQKSFPNILDSVIVKLQRNEVRVDLPYPGCCKYVDPMGVYGKYTNVTNLFSRFVYMQSHKYFANLPREEIIQTLQFSKGDNDVAAKEIVEKKYNLESSHNVCVHVRRGDFVTSKLHQHSTEEFTRESLKFAVAESRKLTNKTVTAVILGNDYAWQEKIIKQLGEVDYAAHVGKQNFKYWAPHVDWVFSQLYCDTVVLTASGSTYGWWLAFFSRGQRTYYNKVYSKPNGLEKEFDESAFWPKSWIKIQQMASLNIQVV